MRVVCWALAAILVGIGLILARLAVEVWAVLNDGPDPVLVFIAGWPVGPRLLLALAFAAFALAAIVGWLAWRRP